MINTVEESVLYDDQHSGECLSWDYEFNKFKVSVHFLDLSHTFMKLWQQIFSLVVSLERLIPYGRSDMRSLQWQLKSLWSIALGSPETPSSLSQECMDNISCWINDGDVFLLTWNSVCSKTVKFGISNPVVVMTEEIHISQSVSCFCRSSIDICSSLSLVVLGCDEDGIMQSYSGINSLRCVDRGQGQLAHQFPREESNSFGSLYLPGTSVRSHGCIGEWQHNCCQQALECGVFVPLLVGEVGPSMNGTSLHETVWEQVKETEWSHHSLVCSRII